jgi:diguanylate cyclase (GGDEF)-like protein
MINFKQIVKKILFREQTKRILLVLLINIISSGILITVLVLTKFFTIFVIGAIPIIIVGWYFYKRDVIFSVIFIFFTEIIFIIKYGLMSSLDTQSLMQGLVAYSLFTIVAIIINKIKNLNDKIYVLNEQLLIKNKELENISIRDHLTNLYNRRYAQEYMYEYANKFLHQLTKPDARKRGSSFFDTVIIVILADIDNFKQINDVYGHKAGDNILIEISERLTAALRFDDIIIRWGGEEFLIICNLAKKDYIQHIVTKILHCVSDSKININQKDSITVTVSIGAAYFPVIAHLAVLFSFDQTILLCDKALYASKQNGRNQAQIIIPNFEYYNKLSNVGIISTDVFFENRLYSTMQIIR